MPEEAADDLYMRSVIGGRVYKKDDAGWRGRGSNKEMRNGWWKPCAVSGISGMVVANANWWE